MRTSIIIGSMVALFTGLAISSQATLTSRVGAVVGNLQTGFLTSIFGGGVGLVLASCWYLFRPESWRVTPDAAIMLLIAGIMGLFIIAGISFSLQRVGVAAGLAGIIFGQMALSVVLDLRGAGGVDPIPLSLPRVLGLATLALSVFLLLPRN